MEELLYRLEYRIKKLIEQHDQLKESHDQLNQGKHHLLRDQLSLHEKHKRAIAQIEVLLAKLKSIENLT